MKKLKFGAVAIFLLAVAATIFWQRQQIKRLTLDCADLHDQLGQAAALRTENQLLTDQLKTRTDASQTDLRELVRLRNQVSRVRQLEQENSQLKEERQRSDRAVTQVPPTSISSDQPQPIASSELKPTLPAGVTDLGVVEFADHEPMRLELGGGKECMFTATLLTNGNFQAEFSYETVVDGAPATSKHTWQLIPGKYTMGIVNGVEIALTPALKGK